MAIKKMREQSIFERDSKIENMELDELKKYLCMKNYQNPEKCFGCPGIKNCKAGQRAVVLLDRREVEKMNEKKEQTANVPQKVTREQKREENRLNFIDVCQQEKMIEYVMKKYDQSRNSAREKLKYWGNIYTEEAERYGFWEKFGAEYMKPGKEVLDIAKAKTAEAKRKYHEAAEADDPIAFIMDKYGYDKEHAIKNLRQWRKRYGKIEKTASDNTESNADDEISLEDFLKETESEPEAHEEPQPQEEPVQVEKAEKEPKKAKKSDAKCELNMKFYELDRKKQDAREQVAKLERLIADIEKAQDAIVTAMNLLNPDSEIAKGLL